MIKIYRTVKELFCPTKYSWKLWDGKEHDGSINVEDVKEYLQTIFLRK